jgi:glycosyltransferase involved in cell wall biosynthesis
VRILTVGNLYPPQHLGGYELMWQAAVAALRARGHDVHVLTTDTRFRDAPDTEPGIERSLRWYWRDHRFPRFTPITVRRIERHNRLHFRAAAEGADLVSFWSMGGMSLSLLGMCGDTPSVAVVHDLWPLYGPKVDRSFDGMLRLPPALYVSEWVKRRVGQPGRVIPSGYDAAVFRVAPPRDRWEGRLLLPGRIDPRKGHRTALAAFGGARLTIAGAGEPELTAELEAAGATLLGQLEPAALREAYAAADCVLFPVEWDEPWGLVPLEAMAVGRPVVATGRGGSAEYLVDGENCLLVEPGDPNALREAVERLAASPRLRATLRTGGFATAARHTLEQFVQRVADAHSTYASRR